MDRDGAGHFFNLVPAPSPEERSNHVTSAYKASRNRLSAATAGLDARSDFQSDVMASGDGRHVSGAAEAFGACDCLARGRRATVDPRAVQSNGSVGSARLSSVCGRLARRLMRGPAWGRSSFRQELLPSDEFLYNVPTLRGRIMKAVNVRQLKNNPSDALRMARKAPVVIMNRDQPEALLVHLDDEGLLGEPGVRLALATALYKSETISLGRGAKIASIPLADFIQHVSREEIPVIRGSMKTIREDVKSLESWLKKGSSSATRAR